MTEKRFGWGSLVGAIVVGVVATTGYGFTRGGWYTESGAQRLATDTAKTAVVEVLTRQCVIRFEQDPEYVGHLAALKAEGNPYRRGSLVRDGDYATFDKNEALKGSVASACAAALFEG